MAIKRSSAMAIVMNIDAVWAKFLIGHKIDGKAIPKASFEFFNMESTKQVMRSMVSKIARATRSLLKVFSICFCKSTIMIKMFPSVPKVAMTSLVKRSIQKDGNSSFSFEELLQEESFMFLTSMLLQD